MTYLSAVFEIGSRARSNLETDGNPLARTFSFSYIQLGPRFWTIRIEAKRGSETDFPVSGETRSIDGKNNRNRPISFPILQTNLETRNTIFFSFFHSVKWLHKLNVVFYYRLINREQGLFRVCIRYGANVLRVYRRVSIRFIHDTALQLENEQNNMLPFIVHTFVLTPYQVNVLILRKHLLRMLFKADVSCPHRFKCREVESFWTFWTTYEHWSPFDFNTSYRELIIKFYRRIKNRTTSVFLSFRDSSH